MTSAPDNPDKQSQVVRLNVLDFPRYFQLQMSLSRFVIYYVII